MASELVQIKPVSNSDDDDDDEVEEQNAHKKRIRRPVLWKPVPEVTNVFLDQAQAFIESQNTWKLSKTEISKTKGTKKEK